MAWPFNIFVSIATFYLSFNLYTFLPKCTTSDFQELICGSGVGGTVLIQINISALVFFSENPIIYF